MRAFGLLLKSLIEDGLGTRGFAKLVGVSHTRISLICHGRRTPNLGSVGRWADRLGLTGTQRTRFINLAALAHLTPEAETRFLKILDAHDRLVGENKELAAQVEQFRKQQAVRPA